MGYDYLVVIYRLTSLVRIGSYPPIAREDAVRVQALVRLSHSKRVAGPSAVKACETAEESLKAVSGVHKPKGGVSNSSSLYASPNQSRIADT